MWLKVEMPLSWGLPCPVRRVIVLEILSLLYWLYFPIIYWIIVLMFAGTIEILLSRQCRIVVCCFRVGVAHVLGSLPLSAFLRLDNANVENLLSIIDVSDHCTSFLILMCYSPVILNASGASLREAKVRSRSDPWNCILSWSCTRGCFFSISEWSMCRRWFLCILAKGVGDYNIVFADDYLWTQGWNYVGDRLLSAVVPYEETGWYDGQLFVKPPEVWTALVLYIIYSWLEVKNILLWHIIPCVLK